MHFSNRYFTPFAFILIVSAIYFSEPERATQALLAILGASVFINWWILRQPLIASYAGRASCTCFKCGLNFIWAVPLLYLLQPYWGPCGCSS